MSLSSPSHPPVSLEDIQRARAALKGITYVTPLQESSYLNNEVAARVFLKLENLQRAGSFKLRGAYNRMRQMTPAELDRGVVAASAGNHAQGVALAATLVGTTATIVMPEGAAMTKVVATKNYGARVELCGETFDDAFARAEEIARDTGAVMIPAFNDPWVIAGQGTVGLEMLDARPNLDAVVVPVGGGGLVSGVAIAVKSQNPRIRVIGVQAEGAAAMVESQRAGRLVATPGVHTIADGIAVKHPGDLTFQIIRAYVDDMVTVGDHDISRAILLFLERTKLVVEGAGAAAMAAILTNKVQLGADRIGVVVSGGNIDVSLLSRLVEKGLVEEGRQLHLTTTVGDRPGQLAELLTLVARCHANVITVEHQRWQPGQDPGDVEIRLVIETRDQAHADELLAKMAEDGHAVQVLT
jgi:threonine dehydratase